MPDHSANPFPRLVLAASLSFSPAIAQEEMPTLLEETFTRGFAAWETTDPSAWRVRLEEGSTNRVLELHGKSDFEPPHRSPFHIALHRYTTVGDFEMTLKLKTTKEDYGHRDLCLFFGYQDPAHFYYVHLGQKADDHANQIFIVNDAPRVKISEKSTAGTPWKEDHFHSVKLVRRVESGLIEVYFDDMDTPVMTAHDPTFRWGRIGVGSFDDTGLFDNIVVKGVEAKPQGSRAPADPKTLKYTPWTPDFQIHNAIALSFDGQGRAYVTGARRRKAQDLAIDDRKEWMVDDLRLRTVEEKRALYHSKLSPEGGKTEEAKRFVEDFNGDGSHDWRDLTVLSDTVYLVEDRDDDGVADTFSPYASDMKTEVTGSMAGVLYHDGDVYVTASPDLVKLRDADGDGMADQRESIAHGFGVHIAYAGHYMHGLNVGPDGRIYWSIGDKGIHVTSREGDTWAYPDEGVMMRCEPDGSNFEVYARGLRNLQEPRFDQYGNWIGVDNDGDSPGEMERLVYLVQHSDAGWRINWQYFKGDYNFWTSEELYNPWFEGQAGHILPCISSYVNGPSGFAWNPGTALSPDYQNYFFITQFASGFQNAFQLEPDGASFRMVNDHVIGNGVPLVGLNWGPDGGLYGTDWGGGYPLNDEGGVWKIDVPEYAESEERKETALLLREGMEKRETEELGNLLGHADQRIRLAAQFELVSRQQSSVFESILPDSSAQQMARIHALWGWAQLERRKDARRVETVLPLAGDPDAEIRAQFARTIGDMGTLTGNEGVEKLTALLKDDSDRVRMLAAISLGNLKAASAADALIDFAGTIAPSEAYLRHGAIAGLASCATGEALATLAKDENAAKRRAAVIALRRQGNPEVALFLSDPDPFIASDAARAIHDAETVFGETNPLQSALPKLAAELVSTSHETEAFLYRAINANFRLGDSDSAGRLAQFAADVSRPIELRLNALDALTQWIEPSLVDRIEGNYRQHESREPAPAAERVEPFLADLLADEDSRVREATLRAASPLQIQINPAALLTVVEDNQAAVDLRIEALKSLASQEAGELQTAVESALSGTEPTLRSEALRQLATFDPAGALQRVDVVLKNGTDNSEAQVAMATLGQLAMKEADQRVLDWTKKLTTGEVPLPLQLDVIEVAQSRSESVPEIKAALAAFESSRDATNLDATFRECLEGGNAEAGRVIFQSHVAAQCVRCHRDSKGAGSTIGPNLMSIGKERDRASLLQSIILPQEVIVPGYGSIAVTKKDGSSVSGLFQKETETHVEIRDAENQTIEVPVAEIASRTPVLSTMPPMNLLLKKREIRDLVEYLSTLRAK